MNVVNCILVLEIISMLICGGVFMWCVYKIFNS